MIKRIIEVSNPSYLKLENTQLIIEQEKVEIARVPIEDIGALILSHPAIVVTQPLIVACSKNKVAIIFCDERHLPCSLILPLYANTRHQRVLQQQIHITEPTRKRLWQQIIQQKIRHQCNTLIFFDKPSDKLTKLVDKVRSGDSSNCEAIAASAYWKALFGKDFIRNPDGEDINIFLNYGYSIIRAMVARSICAAGLHPTLGLFHHNQYNALCLADDLMEPFRPWIDAITYQYGQQHQICELTEKTKSLYLKLPSQPISYNGENVPLMTALHYLMADLKRNYTNEIKQLKYPQLSLIGLL